MTTWRLAIGVASASFSKFLVIVITKYYIVSRISCYINLLYIPLMSSFSVGHTTLIDGENIHQQEALL